MVADQWVDGVFARNVATNNHRVVLTSGRFNGIFVAIMFVDSSTTRLNGKATRATCCASPIAKPARSSTARSPTLYEVFFVKRKICVVSGPGRRVGGPLEARSCPSKPWRRQMSLGRDYAHLS